MNTNNDGTRPEIPNGITPSEYFNNLIVDRINMCPVPKISSLNFLVEFCVNGENGGSWGLIVKKGTAMKVIQAVEGEPDPYNQKPDCRFTMDNEVFLDIIHKRISPQKAFFTRKVNVNGNMFLALKSNVLVNYL